VIKGGVHKLQNARTPYKGLFGTVRSYRIGVAAYKPRIKASSSSIGKGLQNR
jgi:hypothetical protein